MLFTAARCWEACCSVKAESLLTRACALGDSCAPSETMHTCSPMTECGTAGLRSATCHMLYDYGKFLHPLGLFTHR